MDSIERLRAWFPWAAEAELTPEESETTARYIRWRFLTGKEFQFFLFLQRTNTVIGVCALCNPGWSTPQFEMSYWLRTGYEGQGYITEAVMAVTEFAFRTLGARRVEICCDSLNVGAIAVARRVGYVHEATLQRARQDQQSGEWRDVMIFAQEVK
jgi:RimJ/RimL family protein N-acetyltransferase